MLNWFRTDTEIAKTGMAMAALAAPLPPALHRLTRRATRRRVGASHPKRRVEVGGLGKTKDLRGRAGRRTLLPR